MVSRFPSLSLLFLTQRKLIFIQRQCYFLSKVIVRYGNNRWYCWSVPSVQMSALSMTISLFWSEHLTTSLDRILLTSLQMAMGTEPSVTLNKASHPRLLLTFQKMPGELLPWRSFQVNAIVCWWKFCKFGENFLDSQKSSKSHYISVTYSKRINHITSKRFLLQNN